MSKQRRFVDLDAKYEGKAVNYSPYQVLLSDLLVDTIREFSIEYIIAKTEAKPDHLKYQKEALEVLKNISEYAQEAFDRISKQGGIDEK